MTITKEKNMLRCGRDFADCFTGKIKSHGWVELGPNGMRIEWQSTFGQDETCGAIRKAVEKEGLKAVGFMSQAI